LDSEKQIKKTEMGNGPS